MQIEYRDINTGKARIFDDKPLILKCSTCGYQMLAYAEQKLTLTYICPHCKSKNSFKK